MSRFNRDPEPGGLGPFYGSVLLATTSLEPALWAVLISQKWLRRADRHIYHTPPVSTSVAQRAASRDDYTPQKIAKRVSDRRVRSPISVRVKRRTAHVMIDWKGPGRAGIYL